MKTPNLFIGLVLALTLNLQFSIAHAQGTAFTYQGRLNSGNAPANGIYDLRFTLYDSTNSPGNVIAGPLTNSATSVSNGLFTALLDFGPGVFTGTSNWLEIAVSTNGANNFVTLSPRQQLTPAPYAIFAEGANASGLSGTILPANIANGSITGSMLAPGAVSQLGTPNGSNPGAVAVDNNGFVGIGTNNTGAALQIGGGIIYSNTAGITYAGAVSNNVAGLTNFSTPIGVFVDGTRAYVSTYFPGSVEIFDITSPLQPVLIGQVLGQTIDPNSPFQLRGADGIFVTNNVAYVTAENDNTLTIINVANPQSPVKLAEVKYGVGGVQGLNVPTCVIVSGTNCYVLGFISSSVTILDISNPSNPKVLSEIFDNSVVPGSTFTNMQYPYHMAMSGTKLFIPSRLKNAMSIVDVSNPVSPQLAGQIVDQSSNPASPFTKLSNANWVEVVGNIAYIASGAFYDHPSSLTIADVSNPATPVKLSEIADARVEPGSPFTTLSGAWGVKVVGNTAFVSCTSAFAGGGYLTAIDVSDPRQPRLLKYFGQGVNGLNSNGILESMAVSGTTLYLCDDGNPGALDVFDLRSQLGLDVAGFVGIGTTSPKTALDVAGTVSAQSLDVSGTLQASGPAGFGSVASQGSIIVDAANTNPGTNSPGLFFGSAGTEGIASKRTPGGNQSGLDFYTGGTVRMSIAKNGNIGIGNTSPDSLMTVGNYGSPNDNFVTVETGGGGLYKAGINFRHFDQTFGWTLQSDTPAKAFELVSYYSQTVGTVRMMIDRFSGNVGIGTVNPAAKLQVAGSFIGGGPGNTVATNIGYSTIAGGGVPGFANVMLAESSFIGAGNANTISSNINNAFIGAGYGNYQAGVASFIGGGNLNSVRTNSPFSVIGGGNGNTIQSHADFSVIGGGQNNTIANFYSASSGFTVSGATIGGGLANTVAEYDSFIGGGQGNFIGEAADHATIAGGGFNTILGSAGPALGFIGGGQGNYLGTNLAYAAVSGGISNAIQTLADGSFIGGGSNNVVNSGDVFGTIGGGAGNVIGGSYATVAGGFGNTANGNYSFAAGDNAQAANSGSFVWADAQGTPFTSTVNNSFNVRANGGAAFVTSGAGVTVDGKPVLTSGSVGAITQANLGTTNSYTPIVGNGSFNFTTSTQSGYYAKVGNLVYFEAWVIWTGKGLAASGNLSVTLPPVPVASPRAAFNIGYISGITGVSQLIAITSGGGTTVSIDSFSGTTGNTAGVPVTSCATTGEIQITGSYRWQ